MQLQTLGQIKNSRIIQIAGVCKTGPEFRQFVNDGTQLLLERGDWPGLLIPMQVCLRNGCVVWPRSVGRVRRLSICHRTIRADNFWWNYVDTGDYKTCCGQDLDIRRLTNMGRSPTYNDIPGLGLWKIRVTATKATDIGKTVTIFGLDSNGQILRHKDSDNLWQEGLVLALQKPHGESPMYVRQIDRVWKDVTQGDVFLFAYDPARDLWWDLARYAPDEENPGYAKDDLKSCGCCNGANPPQSVVALVKLQFVPVTNDNDLVLCPSLMALKLVIQGIKRAEGGDNRGYTENLLLAVNELNHVLDNETPPEDAPINPHFAGHECVGFQTVI